MAALGLSRLVDTLTGKTRGRRWHRLLACCDELNILVKTMKDGGFTGGVGRRWDQELTPHTPSHPPLA